MKELITVNMSLAEFKTLVRDILNETSLEQRTLKGIEEDEKPMNQRQAAKFMSVSEVTIINWKKQGKIPYEQLPGSTKVRFYKSQLRAVFQKNPHLLRASRN